MQRFWWSFVHNCIAHPLLFLTADSQLAIRLHDYSGERAWPSAR